MVTLFQAVGRCSCRRPPVTYNEFTSTGVPRAFTGLCLLAPWAAPKEFRSGLPDMRLRPSKAVGDGSIGPRRTTIGTISPSEAATGDCGSCRRVLAVRFLIISTDYAAFLSAFYSRSSGCRMPRVSPPRWKRGCSTLIRTSPPFYSRNLRALQGAGQSTIHAQQLVCPVRAWAASDSGRPGRPGDGSGSRRGFVPGWATGRRGGTWMSWRLRVGAIGPDVVLNQALDEVSGVFLSRARASSHPACGTTCAAGSARYPGAWLARPAHLVGPSNVSAFAALGVPCALHRLGFEGRLIDEFRQDARTLPVTFVGSFFSVHSSRTRFFEELCSLVPDVQVWTDSWPVSLRIPRSARPGGDRLGGREMYRVLADSRITLNHHGDVGPCANNLRLFEATGMGALLITDAKSNLSEMFIPGEEVVDYRDVSECADLIRYYLDNEPGAGPDRRGREGADAARPHLGGPDGGVGRDRPALREEQGRVSPSISHRLVALTHRARHLTARMLSDWSLRRLRKRMFARPAKTSGVEHLAGYLVRINDGPQLLRPVQGRVRSVHLPFLQRPEGPDGHRCGQQTSV